MVQNLMKNCTKSTIVICAKKWYKIIWKSKVSDGGVNRWINKRWEEKKSKKDFNVNVSNEDTILTLSTCANNNKYRVVLHSVRVK